MRQIMAEEMVDAYIVPTADAHNVRIVLWEITHRDYLIHHHHHPHRPLLTYST
jgi:hypothetical protein